MREASKAMPPLSHGVNRLGIMVLNGVAFNLNPQLWATEE